MTEFISLVVVSPRSFVLRAWVLSGNLSEESYEKALGLTGIEFGSHCHLSEDMEYAKSS